MTELLDIIGPLLYKLIQPALDDPLLGASFIAGVVVGLPAAFWLLNPGHRSAPGLIGGLLTVATFFTTGAVAMLAGWHGGTWYIAWIISGSLFALGNVTLQRHDGLPAMPFVVFCSILFAAAWGYGRYMATV